VAAPPTRPTDADVGAFLEVVPDERRREDARAVRRLTQEVIGRPPAPCGVRRKTSTTVRLVDGFEQRTDLLERLGLHPTGKSCPYLERLADIDQDVLRSLAAASVAQAREQA